jgi:hypothetical protein
MSRRQAREGEEQRLQTWSEAEIARIEATHAIGSKERLAFALMLYTGQRRGDVVKMGAHHIHVRCRPRDRRRAPAPVMASTGEQADGVAVVRRWPPACRPSTASRQSVGEIEKRPPVPSVRRRDASKKARKRDSADRAVRAEAEGVIQRWNDQLAIGPDMLWSLMTRAALLVDMCSVSESDTRWPLSAPWC